MYDGIAYNISDFISLICLVLFFMSIQPQGNSLSKMEVQS